MRRKNEAILSILYRLHIISPKGIFVWAKSLIYEGISLMALLRFAAHFYPHRCAITDEKQSLSYQELYVLRVNSLKFFTRNIIYNLK